MMLFTETLLAFANEAIQKALALDPYTAAELNALHDRTIAVTVEKINKTIYMHIENQSIYLSLHSSHAIDLTITAAPKDLWDFAQQNHTPSQKISMQGNMHLAQQLSQIMQQFDPDWEEALSEKLGDVAGVAVAKILTRAHAYAKDITKTLLQNSADYVVDEVNVIAAKPSVDDFIHAVDKLRAQSDRLWVRSQSLKEQL